MDMFPVWDVWHKCPSNMFAKEGKKNLMKKLPLSH